MRSSVVTPLEDLNVNFLRSLPSEWDTHVVVWINKPDFDTMGLDDLYNNFKLFNSRLRKTAGERNDDYKLSISNILQVASSRRSNLVFPIFDDLEQLHDDDLEEMGLKWNMTLLSMRARKFYQRTGRKIIIDGSNTADYVQDRKILIKYPHGLPTLQITMREIL
ncbi:hypothetical protein Tco_0857641 [Tanacetum coccineum]|uniref:Uncharacterized protein n=1 Tax=Tanacetum coccineum TaxID=301880 RepID=A0ABQ5BCI1_9ASTR